ncbi:cation diffusion facilitator family transporter [Bacteroidales bacterium OttesenSCG-928-C19]|nr:cation diffusion facilitator family transporter [Bacteroidales bacterium OttesenSCG-928-C19]
MHDHTHHHGHIHSHGSESTKNIRTAFLLNILFAIIELIGGLITNSVAILSDALHDFGDSISLGVAWYLQKLSNKKRDKNYSYGYKRFSLLGAVFISFILIIGSVFVIKECVARLMEPQEPNAKGMLILAVLGIVVNGIAVLRLRKGKSFNEKAVTLHMLEDVLGWAAVLIASIVMMIVYVPVLDPIMSIMITLWVLYNAYRNLKNTFQVLLQETPKDIDIEKLKSELLSIDKVVEIHDFHLWSLDGENHIMTFHVVVQNLRVEDVDPLRCKIREIASVFGIKHTTIEIETAEGGKACDCNCEEE